MTDREQTMGTKFGLITGLAVGYVLGAQAGRERYEEIRHTFDEVMGSSTAKTLEGGLRDAWATAQREFPGAAGTIGQTLNRE
ncbi:MAG: hypothetical protein ACR2HR_17885 [Euzebya sp.]